MINILVVGNHIMPFANNYPRFQQVHKLSTSGGSPRVKILKNQLMLSRPLHRTEHELILNVKCFKIMTKF